MDNRDYRGEDHRIITFFANERLEDYMALSLAALILIVVLLFY